MLSDMYPPWRYSKSTKKKLNCSENYRFSYGFLRAADRTGGRFRAVFLRVSGGVFFEWPDQVAALC